MAPAFLDEGEQSAVLGAELSQRVAQGVELLGANRTGRFRDVFVLGGEGRKNPAEFLATEVIDAGIACEAKEPRFKLRRRVQTIDRAHHFDEDELRDIFDGVAAADDRVNKTGHTVLVSHDELALSIRFAALGAENKFDRRCRLRGFHVVFIALP